MPVIDPAYIRRHVAYFTECELATMEHYETRRSASKHERERHRKIAAKMVEFARAINVTTADAPGCPRLMERLVLTTGDSLP